MCKIIFATMSEKFCLKWNDFQSNVSNSFSLLRSEDYLHDVTIVTDDNEQIAAHKLVLSACSEYFKSIFKKSKHSHPLLCLEGVSSKDVRNMMDYMYNGELQIFQEDLDRFLNVAQRLKLEGLITDPNADADQEEEETEQNIEETEPIKNTETKFHENFSKVRQEKAKPKGGQERMLAKLSTDISYPDNISEVNEQIEQNLVKNMDGTYSCKVCDKNSGRNIVHCRNHIETHIEGLSFNCPFCEKTYRSRPSLAMHKSTKHRNY